MSLFAMSLEKCPQCETPLQEQNQGQASFCSTCRFPLMLVAGKYRLESKLGEGGAGVVYLARHIGLSLFNERVIKVLKSSLFEKEGAKERFHREVQVTANLSEHNSHIVRIYDDFGEEPQLGPYYVMEYLRGESLKDRLERGERLPLEQVFHIFRQLCLAVGAAHRAGIIHRDLKPENIFLTRRDHDDSFVKILDFGLARPTDTSANVTQGVFGTPAYMSPEQCQGNAVDARTDIYSMGIILYEMLAGELPYVVPRHESMTLLVAHIAQPPIPLLNHRPDLSVGLNHAVLLSLKKEPEQRYATALEFWEALAGYARDPSGSEVQGSGYRQGSGVSLLASPVQDSSSSSFQGTPSSTLGYGGGIPAVQMGADDEPTFVMTEPLPLPSGRVPGRGKDESSTKPKPVPAEPEKPNPFDPTKTLAQEMVPEELLRQAGALNLFPASEVSLRTGDSTEIATLAVVDEPPSPSRGIAEYQLDELLMDDASESAASQVVVNSEHADAEGSGDALEEPGDGEKEQRTVRAVNPMFAASVPSVHRLMLDTDPSVHEKPITRGGSLAALLLDDDEKQIPVKTQKESQLQEPVLTLREDISRALSIPSVVTQEQQGVHESPVLVGEARMADLSHIRTVPLSYRQNKTNWVWWLLVFLLLAFGMITVAIYLLVNN